MDAKTDRRSTPFAARFLSRLSRRTSTTSFIPEIDGIRFVAIAAVVAAHVSSFASGAYLLEHPGAFTHGLLWRTLQLGQYGVQMFFVLSGFILALPFAAHYLSAGKKVSLAVWIDHNARLSLSLLGSLQYFLAGFLLADIYLIDWRRNPKLTRSWDLATLAAIGIFVLVLPGSLGRLVLPFLILLFFVGGLRGSRPTAFAQPLDLHHRRHVLLHLSDARPGAASCISNRGRCRAQRQLPSGLGIGIRHLRPRDPVRQRTIFPAGRTPLHESELAEPDPAQRTLFQVTARVIHPRVDGFGGNCCGSCRIRRHWVLP